MSIKEFKVTVDDSPVTPRDENEVLVSRNFPSGIPELKVNGIQDSISLDEATKPAEPVAKFMQSGVAAAPGNGGREASLDNVPPSRKLPELDINLAERTFEKVSTGF
jgi:hypothetical protein